MRKTLNQRQADIAKGYRYYVVVDGGVVSKHKSYSAATKSAAKRYGCVGIREINL